MAHDKTVAAAGEPPVSDQRNVAADPLADNGARRTQHLAHARASFRSFIANHDDIARPNAPAQDALQRLLLGFEDPSRAIEAQALLARNLGDCALGSKISVEDHQVAIFLDRVREW